MMKHTLLAAFLLCAGLLCFGASVPRVVQLSGKIQKVKTFEIVMENPTKLLQFAALEMQTFLHKATGFKPQIVARPTGKNIALVLGDNSFARKANIDVKKLPAEGYYIIRKGNMIYLAGKDSPKNHPWTNSWRQEYQRGTLSAVYDFLERFAKARFFFAGEAGTINPYLGAIALPAKINILERPDMSHRDYYHSRTIRYPGYRSNKKFPHGETLTRIRLRFSENLINYGHGQCFLNLINRFGKSHPEYFALMTDGRRCKEKNITHTGHLCYNSNIVEELYQDAKAYLTGKPSVTRGIPKWRGHNKLANVFNVMPQDWLYWCGCPKCSKIADAGRSKIYSDLKQQQAVSDFIWKITADIGRRLKKEGIKGGIAQMAYTPYIRIPKSTIPDNVYVMVATKGVGATKDNEELLSNWYKKKSNSKIVVWTYFIGKHMNKTIPGIPPMAPQAIGDYVDAYNKYLDGGFFESETDYLLFQYLNYYILAKKMWNNSLSTRELLNDHYRAMFGKGAPFIKKFYEYLETAWCKKIVGNVVNTGLGPVSRIPSDFQIWNEIFSPAWMKEFNNLFDSARKAAASDKDAVKRIDYIRKNLFGPLEKESQKFAANQSARDSWILTCPGSVYLRPYKGEVNEVSTKVSVRKDVKDLIFTFDCEEPRMKDILARATKRDSKMVYTDSDVEILINPSGDLENYYQFAVNANGAIADYKCRHDKLDISWNSSATAKAVKKTSSWSVTVRIPLKDLGKLNPKGIPVNFARHRALKGKKAKEIYYQWSPTTGKRGGFHALNYWGKLSFAKEKKYFLKEDFTSGKIPGLWLSGGRKGGQVAKIDNKVFISGGKSLYYKNVKNKSISSAYSLKGLKPSTKYRLSYYIKTKDLKSHKDGAGAFIYFNKNKGIPYPKINLLGNNPWHRLQFDFKTPADTGKGRVPVLGLWIWSAAGEVWFDDIRIEEIR